MLLRSLQTIDRLAFNGNLNGWNGRDGDESKRISSSGDLHKTAEGKGRGRMAGFV